MSPRRGSSVCFNGLCSCVSTVVTLCGKSCPRDIDAAQKADRQTLSSTANITQVQSPAPRKPKVITTPKQVFLAGFLSPACCSLAGTTHPKIAVAGKCGSPPPFPPGHSGFPPRPASPDYLLSSMRLTAPAGFSLIEAADRQSRSSSWMLLRLYLPVPAVRWDNASRL